MPKRTFPTYWDYLRLDELLSLQGGMEGDEDQLMPDELHFILVHQTMELWFKLVIRELRLARDHLAAPALPDEQVPYVVHHLRRINEILRLCIQQWQVVETLTPQDFLAFRDKLVPASGFQSFQLREIEILMGLEESQRATLGKVQALDYIKKMADKSPAGARAWRHISAAREETTLRTALHNWLYRTPIQGSTPEEMGDEATVDTFLEAYLAAGAKESEKQLQTMLEANAAPKEALEARFAEGRVQTRAFLFAEDVDGSDRRRAKRIRAALLFIESYRDLPLLAWPRVLVDTVVEFEEQMVLFRHRHARMVERTIGRRVGTGGSSGVDYLDKTTKYRVFQELWAVRTVLLRKDALPELSDKEPYGFAT
jgi:tryptophan 2,3-dioxygenase